jgi:hypothetical protein
MSFAKRQGEKREVGDAGAGMKTALLSGKAAAQDFSVGT